MSASTAHEIGIVHYPGAQVACILGLTDLFGVASTIALDQPRSGQSPLRVTHWKPIHCGAANLSCVYDSAPRGSPVTSAPARTSCSPAAGISHTATSPAGVTVSDKAFAARSLTTWTGHC